MRLNRFKNISWGLRALLCMKGALLLGIWLAYDRGFTLGDRTALAKDEAPIPVDGKSALDTQKKDSEDENTGKKTADDKPAVRKSFLSNLFELPTLDTASIKKEELGHYLDIAERKERQLKDRLTLLKKREDQLKSLEKAIDEKLKQLDEERKFFAQTIQQEKDMKNERVAQLIGMYAKMEPKKAAPVFEKLDKDLVVELFKKLPQKQVTAILEGMSAEKSVQLSEYYGRVRSAREYDVLKEMNQSLRKEFDDCKGLPVAKS